MIGRLSFPEQSRPDWVERTTGEFPFDPFKWDTGYRMEIQSELDAYFAMKYQLEEEELKFILDPAISALGGPNFPGETFRVLKEKEMKKYGEYKTSRLVLDAWNRKPWEEPATVRKRPAAQLEVAESIVVPHAYPMLMGYIIYKHQNPRYSRTLGRTKMEKLLYLIDAETNINLGRVAVKNKYGPADTDATQLAERNAEELKYF